MKINYYSGTEDVLKELGRRIKSLRVDMNISQAELADRVNISRRTISSLENGNDVALGTLVEVLRELGRLQGLDSVVPEVTFRPSRAVYALKPRERASVVRADQVSEEPWKWGDEK